MGIYLPQRWRHQPQGGIEIDQSHPLGGALVFLASAPQGTRDLVNGQQPDDGASSVVRPWPAGLGFSTETNSNADPGRFSYNRPYGERFYDVGSEITVFAYATPNGEDANDSWCIARSIGSAIPAYGVGYYIGSSSTAAIYALANTDNVQLGATGAGVGTDRSRPRSEIVGSPSLVSLTYRAGVVRGYFNGLLVHTNSGADLPIRTSGTQQGLRIMSRSDGVAKNTFTGRLYLAGVCNRALDDVIPSMAENPWQIFKPRRHSFYSFPLGDIVPSPGADLEGAAAASASAAGDLTTQIALAGASLIAATATGSITTGVQLSGDAASVTLASGDLITRVRLEGAALAQAVAAAGLTTAIQLAADAQTGAQASGDLTTPGAPAALAGDAGAAALAVGSITTIIRLDAAAVGRALAAGTLAGGAALLAGDALAQALAAGDLATAIRLAADALASTSAAGQLATTPAGLAGDASAFAIASGGLTTGIALAGHAAAVVQATGTLDLALTFEADAFVQAMAAGVLSTQVRLSGAAVAGAIAQAYLGGDEFIEGVAAHAQVRVLVLPRASVRASVVPRARDVIQ